MSMKYIISENQLKTIIETFNMGNKVILEDKYKDYKKGWYKYDSYGDLEVNDPLNTKIYLFPDEKGFLIELFLNGTMVGSFHCFVDEEGMANDVQINEEYQNKGLGKVLLLKAIDVSNAYLGYFETDTRGTTMRQNHVYKSLNNSGALKNWNELDYDKAQSVIDKISNSFN